MQYLMIALVLMTFCVLGFSCRSYSRPSGPVTTVPSSKTLSRQDIEKQLAYIAKSPPPKNLAVGAMCYDIAGPPERIDYVCPVCGEKTLYVMERTADGQIDQQQWKTAGTVQALESLRRLTQQIDKLEVTLDESQFCSHCSPGIEDPRVALVVDYPDTPEPHRAWDISVQDLQILQAFSKGQLKYTDPLDSERPLKDTLPRLEELLGVDIEESP